MYIKREWWIIFVLVIGTNSICAYRVVGTGFALPDLELINQIPTFRGNFSIAHNYMWDYAIGQIEKERDIASDFTVVQTAIAIVHACFVPLRFALEKDGIYEMEWKTIVPVCATDVVAGLLGGHLGGMICRAWVSEYEAGTRAFAKAIVSGLFANTIWGAATSAAWIIASRQYREYPNSGDYDVIFYGSVGGGILVSSILHPLLVILRK